MQMRTVILFLLFKKVNFVIYSPYYVEVCSLWSCFLSAFIMKDVGFYKGSFSASIDMIT